METWRLGDLETSRLGDLAQASQDKVWKHLEFRRERLGVPRIACWRHLDAQKDAAGGAGDHWDRLGRAQKALGGLNVAARVAGDHRDRSGRPKNVILAYSCSENEISGGGGPLRRRAES